MYEELISYVKQFSDLDDDYILRMVKGVPIMTFKKGHILQSQGNSIEKCFFVLKGIVKQFTLKEDGKEVISNFYTEGDFIGIFSQQNNIISEYSLQCMEDTRVLIADNNSDVKAYDDFPELIEIIPKMLEMRIAEMQERLSMFIGSSPEKRFKIIMETRPNLIERVPQNQLSNYLGITPESFSRIKKRIYNNLRSSK
ncbi:Crp/Fnr family transcriptional regulator [Helicovermis profundi]|uniref:Crp/Fnr family transcriptional regulator n=2 Tax=Helicovermis profundi TaxID=3065157 RepID=A0AAU9E2U7_9FIRM|nr:Crp/Fnr family transcriptional regulator [Clostridia bacterium S502]